MRIAFLGLGLIGGSIARALRDAAGYADAELVAWTPTGDGPRAARAAGVLDRVASDPADAVRDAELVVLAAPPLGCVALLSRLGSELRPALHPGATVTDVASTKAAVTAAAARARLRFVGGHPMAGRETSGFAAAEAGLFRGRAWVITEALGGGETAAVRSLALACGAVPVELAAARHDTLVAAVSHAPLLASVALVEAVAGTAGDVPADWPAAAGLAATGWRDATRLARGDATMGAEIAATNAAAIAAVLRRQRDRVDAWLALLEAPGGPDVDALRVRLAEARARLEEGELMGSPDEQVLVVPRASLVPGAGWLGVRRDDLGGALDVIARDGRFMRRGDAEEDRTHKQVIPYLVLRDGERWFLMRRTRAGGDARLHDLWSIGVGGHLNPGDGDVHGGLEREWAEELVADFRPAYAPVGLLNDDTTPVGAVHLGLVFVADAAGRPVAIRETDKLEGAFATTAEVAAVRDRLETWSRLAFDALTA